MNADSGLQETFIVTGNVHILESPPDIVMHVQYDQVLTVILSSGSNFIEQI
jgi:hypothetical protein